MPVEDCARADALVLTPTESSVLASMRSTLVKVLTLAPLLRTQSKPFGWGAPAAMSPLGAGSTRATT